MLISSFRLERFRQLLASPAASGALFSIAQPTLSAYLRNGLLKLDAYNGGIQSVNPFLGFISGSADHRRPMGAPGAAIPEHIRITNIRLFSQKT
jgi:hypothetical protein